MTSLHFHVAVDAEIEAVAEWYIQRNPVFEAALAPNLASCAAAWTNWIQAGWTAIRGRR